MIRVLQGLERLLAWLAVLASGAMMLLTSGDALARYFLNSPIIGAYEVTEKFLMPASIFLGFAWAYRGGVFIRVTILVDRLPHGARRAMDHLAWAISLACCGMFVWATGRQAARALTEATSLATVSIPVGPAYLLAPVGFFAVCVMLLVDLPRVGRGDAMLFSQDAPST